MTPRIRKKIIAWVPFVLILILGAYLRLYKIDQYLTFLGDEGRDVLIVKRMIVDGKWTLLGPTASVGGFYMGPAYYYFMVPFLWAWRLDPVGPAIMVALFGVATIALLYMVCREIFGTFVAVSASLLYAVSPLVIAYSRSSWNPNIVPFFATLLLYMTYRTTTAQSWKLLFWVGLIFGIGIQLHYTFLFLFPAVAIWLLLHGRTKQHLVWYAYGVAGFIIGFLPFLAFELRHDFTNIRGIATFLSAGKDTGFTIGHFISNVKDVFFRMFSRLVLRIPDTGMFALLTQNQRSMWTGGAWIFASGTVVLSYLGLKDTRVRTQAKGMLRLVFLWLVSSLFLFGMYKKSIYDYYFGIFYTVPFMLSAVALDRIRTYGIIGRLVSIGTLAALVLFNWSARPFIHEPNKQLDQAKRISRAVLDKTDGKPFNFALITGGNSDHAYRYFFEIWGDAPVTIENPLADPLRKTVTDQLMVVCEDPACEPLGNSLWEVAGFGRAQIVGSWDVSVVKVFKLVHYTE